MNKKNGGKCFDPMKTFSKEVFLSEMKEYQKDYNSVAGRERDGKFY